MNPTSAAKFSIRFAIAAVLAVATVPSHAAGILDALIGASRNAPPALYDGDEKIYGPGVMTPDRLKTCVLLAFQLDQTAAVIDQAKGAIRDFDNLIRDAGPRLRMMAELSRTDPSRRAAYEGGVAEYNRWVEQRRQTVRSNNQYVRQLGELSGQFDGQCNGHAYFPSDLASLKPTLPAYVRERLK
ncbi:MAG: hypothetical protein VW268_11450 [Rhodospirillaceae bacterium]